MSRYPSVGRHLDTIASVACFLGSSYDHYFYFSTFEKWWKQRVWKPRHNTPIASITYTRLPWKILSDTGGICLNLNQAIASYLLCLCGQVNLDFRRSKGRWFDEVKLCIPASSNKRQDSFVDESINTTWKSSKAEPILCQTNTNN